MHISRRIAALAAMAAVAGTLASCSGPGPASPPGSAGQPARGPVVTLRVAVYGSPGYRQAGLFSTYQRLHPGIRIVEDVTGAFPAGSPAINAAGAVANPYFGGSPTGRVFALSATRMPATGGPDPTATALAPLVAAALAQVQSGALTPARGWSRLLRQSAHG